MRMFYIDTAEYIARFSTPVGYARSINVKVDDIPYKIIVHIKKAQIEVLFYYGRAGEYIELSENSMTLKLNKRTRKFIGFKCIVHDIDEQVDLVTKWLNEQSHRSNDESLCLHYIIVSDILKDRRKDLLIPAQ